MITAEKKQHSILDFQKEYEIITEICRNVCKDQDLVDDLIQEVTIIWLDLDPEKKWRIQDSKSFRWWTARVVKQQWSSSSSPFFTKYRKHVHNPVYENLQIAEVEYDSTPDENWAKLQRHVRALYPSEFNIFNSYYKKEMTIMEITKHFGVDKNFVWSTLKRVKGSLQRKIDWEVNGWSREELQEALAPLVGRKRLKAEERQLVLDVHWCLHGQYYNNVYDRELVERVLKALVTFLRM